MKCEVIVDKNCEEKVVIYAMENSSLIESIKQLVREHGYGLVGYKDKEIMHLSPADIYCVAIMENKVYAVCENETWQIKERLYVLEEKLPDYFVKMSGLMPLFRERLRCALPTDIPTMFPGGS